MILLLRVLLMHDMPFGCKAHHVSVRFVLHEALGLFLTCSLEFSLSTMHAQFKVSSVPSIFLVVNNLSKLCRVTVHPKALAEILPFKLLHYRRQRNPLRDSISSYFFHSFSFLWHCRMCTPTYIIDRCYYWSALQ